MLVVFIKPKLSLHRDNEINTVNSFEKVKIVTVNLPLVSLKANLRTIFSGIMRQGLFPSENRRTMMAMTVMSPT